VNFLMSNLALSQKLLTDLYKDLGEQEELLSKPSNACPISPQTSRYQGLFAELYRVPGENRVRLVGPVGERPLHVCFLRAGALDKDSEVRTGIIEGVK
jgi:hypothetical protein